MRSLTIVLSLLVSGCISTSYQKGDMKITYTDMFKKANDVSITWGEVGIQIGGISSELTAEDIAAYLKVMGALSEPVK